MLQEEDYILNHRYFCESRGLISRLEITGHRILQVSKMFHVRPSFITIFVRANLSNTSRNLESLMFTSA